MDAGCQTQYVKRGAYYNSSMCYLVGCRSRRGSYKCDGGGLL